MNISVVLYTPHVGEHTRRSGYTIRNSVRYGQFIAQNLSRFYQ